MKLISKRGERNRVGALGEEIAKQHLINKGFSFETQNYLKKWGEIDLIMRNRHKIHFVEVKTVSYETRQQLEVSVQRKEWRPEENVHQKKLRSVGRTAETWILKVGWEGEWQIDVAAVRIVPNEQFATVKIIENVGF